ncbi:3061_t:CDS:2, partial [Acaulospora morrowiae]
FPEPSLFPKRKGSDKCDTGLAMSMIMWTDKYFFPAIHRSVYTSINSSTPGIFTTPEFLSDRSSLFGQQVDLQKLKLDRPQVLDQIRSSFEWVEQQLNDGREWFLDTTTPGVADIQIAINLFFLGITRGASELSADKNYPKAYEWFGRFRKFIKENERPPANISAEEALEIAKKYKPLSARKAQLEDEKDLYRKVGDYVRIEPEDYGKVPVIGKIVSLGSSHVAVRPNDVDQTGIEVAVWFPRIG